MSSILSKIFQGIGTVNYQYSILEHTPYLHSAEQLRTMYKNAVNDYQKGAIMNHILIFEKYTMHHNDYRSLYNKIYDEYSRA